MTWLCCLPCLLFPGQQSSQPGQDRWRKQYSISQFHLLPQSCLSWDQDRPQRSRRFCKRGNMHVLKSSPLQKLSYVFICTVFYLVVCSIFDLVTTYSKRKQLNAATLSEGELLKTDGHLELYSWLSFHIYKDNNTIPTTTSHRQRWLTAEREWLTGSFSWSGEV